MFRNLFEDKMSKETKTFLDNAGSVTTKKHTSTAWYSSNTSYDIKRIDDGFYSKKPGIETSKGFIPLKDIITEARTKKPGNPNAKSPSETKEEKIAKDKKKHKGNKMHETVKTHGGIIILENVLSKKLLKNLETLADVQEADIKILPNGFKFTFERSQVANHCMVVSYMDKVITELRKKTDNLMEGQMDILVAEEVIKEAEFADWFESKTGIYLSYNN